MLRDDAFLVPLDWLRRAVASAHVDPKVKRSTCLRFPTLTGPIVMMYDAER